MEWQTTLKRILAYLDDERLEDGVEMLVGITEDDVAFHRRCLSALDEAISSVGRTREALEIINDGHTFRVGDAAETLTFLGAVKAEYVKKYDAVLESRPRPA